MNPLVVKWVLIGLLLASCFGAGWKVNGDRWEGKYQKLQAEYDQFKGGVAALGEAAKLAADKEARRTKLAKEKADEANRYVHDNNLAVIERLRRDADGARSGGVPPAPAASGRPDLVCFDRTEYQRAYGGLVKEVRGLADEGTAATVDLDTGKAWIKSLKE